MRRSEAGFVSAFPQEEDLLGEVEAGAPWRLHVRPADQVAVVLGRGNQATREVRGETCAAEGVPVLRRLGGGGAVVLSPGCLVITLAKSVDRELEVGGYMDRVVGMLRDCVARLTGVALEPRGTGDLCVGDRKVLGSSLFRRRRLLLYQGSLLVSVDLGLVDRYLLHPSREPEYRRGRPHAEFLTTLEECGVTVQCEELAVALWGELSPRVGEIR